MRTYRKEIRKLKRDRNSSQRDYDRWTANGLYNIAGDAKAKVQYCNQKIERYKNLQKEFKLMIVNPKHKIFGKIVSTLTRSHEGFIILAVWFNGLYVISNITVITFAITAQNSTLLTYSFIATLIAIFVNVNFYNRSKKVLYTEDFSGFLKNDFLRLTKANDRYHQNIAAASSGLKAKVTVDKAELNTYLWALSNDLFELQKFFKKSEDDGEALSSNQKIVFQPTINQLKAEITKVEEIVKNLVSISIVDTREKINTKYVTPSTGDSLSTVSKIRLQASLELTGGSDNINL